MSRKWTFWLGAPLFAALACGGDGAVGLCEEKDVHYALQGDVRAAPTVDKARLAAPVVVEVYESSSITSCDAHMIQQLTPGKKLTGTTLARLGELSMDVRAKTIQGIASSLEVRAWLDSDDDGECDRGEPIGTAVLEPDDLQPLDIVLSRTDCAPRL